MALIAHLLGRTRAYSASDLHLRPGLAPRVRVQGRLIPLEGEAALPAQVLEDLLAPLLDDEGRARLARDGAADALHRDEAGTSWRCHVFQERHGLAAAFRTLAAAAPTLEELGLPPTLARLAHLRQGLVLFSGASGAGKTTTMAAIVALVGRDDPRTILTIEDPIEYVHASARSLVLQRGVGVDAPDWPSAVADAMAFGPDCLVLGELRDVETARAALAAAETGTLVLATLHGLDATQAVDRLIDLFPDEERHIARLIVSECLQGVVCQVLVPRLAGKTRRAACELLLRTPAVAAIIRDGRLHELGDCIQTGRALGMQRLDDHLEALVAGGEIELGEARRASRDPRRFEDRTVPSDDRRHEPRLRSLALVEVTERDEVDRPIDVSLGRTLDLSHDGVRLELPHPLLLRSRVDLKLVLGEEVLEARAEVRTVEARDPRRCRIGLRFLALTPAAREALDRWIRVRA